MSAPDPSVILIVDDEEGIRDVVMTVAKRIIPDTRVLSVPDAFAAERLVRENTVRGILTDLRMPGRSGIELVKLVSEISPDTRCALMTGFQEDVIDGVQLADLRLVGILRKPFRTADLRKVLEQLAS